MAAPGRMRSVTPAATARVTSADSGGSDTRHPRHGPEQSNLGRGAHCERGGAQARSARVATHGAKHMPPASRGPRGDQHWSTIVRDHTDAIAACDFSVAVTATFVTGRPATGRWSAGAPQRGGESLLPRRRHVHRTRIRARESRAAGPNSRRTCLGSALRAALVVNQVNLG